MRRFLVLLLIVVTASLTECSFLMDLASNITGIMSEEEKRSMEIDELDRELKVISSKIDVTNYYLEKQVEIMEIVYKDELMSYQAPYKFTSDEVKSSLELKNPVK